MILLFFGGVKSLVTMYNNYFWGHILKKKPRLLWENMVKALPADSWFERNERTFHDKEMSWLDRFESAPHNASLGVP